MKKTYLYYGTEENFYEVEKHETNNVAADIKTFLKDAVETDEEKENLVKEFSSELNSKGYAYHETENEQGYNIFLGFAKEGYCRRIRSLLENNRRMCMEMGGF